MISKVVFNNIFISLFIVLCTLGCNNKSQIEGLVPVKGVVFYDGKPLDGAIVNFIPNSPDKRSAVGTTDAAGKFGLTTLHSNDGVLPGEYKVTVSKMSYPENNESLTDDQSAKLKDDIKSLIPVRYSIPANSGLTATVSDKGVMNLKFELEK
jgi:uncharacterized lipoprotein NlpE involved in copper resistance